jgi:hypothetical protein
MNNIIMNMNFTKSNVGLKDIISYESSIISFREIENQLICYWDILRLTVYVFLLSIINLDKSQ